MKDDPVFMIFFVNEVQKYPCIWNYQLKEFERKELVKNIQLSSDKDFVDHYRQGHKSELYAISREQVRRLSLPINGSNANASFFLKGHSTSSSLVQKYPTGIALPNSVVRRERKSIDSTNDMPSDREEKQKRRLSDKEIEEMIVRRLTNENIHIDLDKNTKKTEEGDSDADKHFQRNLFQAEKKKKKRKSRQDKEKEMNRILRRTSLMKPFYEGRLSTSEAIREAIENSEEKNNYLLFEPEELVNFKRPPPPEPLEKPPAESTTSWIRRVSESLSQSARRVSELNEKMAERRNAKAKEEPEAELSPPIIQPKPQTPTKEKSVKKKSSLKLSKFGSGTTHPTIHEVDEGNQKRPESRQTQASASSFRSTRTSARSSGSISRRTSFANEGIKQIRSGSKQSMRSSSRKLPAIPKDKNASKALPSGSIHSSDKDNEEIYSKKSNISQRSSVSEKRSAGSRQRSSRSSLRSNVSRQKVEGQTSRTSSRARSVSSDEQSSDTGILSTVEGKQERVSLAQLIDLYYSSNERRSTLESLQTYKKSIMERKPSEINEKNTVFTFESKAENAIRFAESGNLAISDHGSIDVPKQEYEKDITTVTKQPSQTSFVSKEGEGHQDVPNTASEKSIKSKPEEDSKDIHIKSHDRPHTFKSELNLLVQKKTYSLIIDPDKRQIISKERRDSRRSSISKNKRDSKNSISTTNTEDSLSSTTKKIKRDSLSMKQTEGKRISITKSDDKSKRNSITKSDDKVKRNSITKSDDKVKRNSITKSDDKVKRNSITESDDKQKRNSITESDDKQKRNRITESDDKRKRNSITESDDKQKRNSITESDDKVKRSSITKSDDKRNSISKSKRSSRDSDNNKIKNTVRRLSATKKTENLPSPRRPSGPKKLSSKITHDNITTIEKRKPESKANLISIFNKFNNKNLTTYDLMKEDLK